MVDDNTKNNVSIFSRDAFETGSYAYTGTRLSSALANERMSYAATAIYPMEGKRILDLGCGDGSYSLDLIRKGAASVFGIDPAEAAVATATINADTAGLSTKATFQTGNLYSLDLTERFDCIVLRGVLHHLPDAARALEAVATFADNILIIEANGANPLLKLIEKTSKYHIEHEEQSFCAFTVKKWLAKAGMKTVACNYVNLVPMFCPDWMARICKVVEPLVEAVPGMRNIACGQYVILAKK